MSLRRDKKGRVLLATILALGCLATATTHANAYSALYIFGDSLSDSGNIVTFAVTDGTAPPPQPRTHARSSRDTERLMLWGIE